MKITAYQSIIGEDLWIFTVSSNIQAVMANENWCLMLLNFR